MNDQLAFKRLRQYTEGAQLCGEDYKDLVFTADFEWHSVQPVNRFKIKFTSNLDQDQRDESWGVRNLNIFPYHKTPLWCENSFINGNNFGLCLDCNISYPTANCTTPTPLITDAN